MIEKAIISLRPNAAWVLIGDSYDGLDWQDPNQSKPTKEEVLQEIERLNLEQSKSDYQRKRAAEYPSFAQQFDLLYHGGYDAWKQEIDKIKTKYPKPV